MDDLVVFQIAQQSTCATFADGKHSLLSFKKRMRARGLEPPLPEGNKDLNLPDISSIAFLILLMGAHTPEHPIVCHSSEQIFTGFSPEKKVKRP
jgi:hypothetical protein